MRKPILKEDNGTRHTVCFWFFSLVFAMIFQVEECSNPRSKSNKKAKPKKKKIEEKKYSAPMVVLAVTIALQYKTFLMCALK